MALASSDGQRELAQVQRERRFRFFQRGSKAYRLGLTDPSWCGAGVSLSHDGSRLRRQNHFVPAAGLGGIEGNIGAAQQFFRRLARGDGGTDADGDAERCAVLDGYLQGRDQGPHAFGGCHGLTCAHSWQQEQKLLSSPARHHVNHPQRGLAGQNQRSQNGIAGGVAETVVDCLEMVDVQQQYCEGSPVARSPGKFREEQDVTVPAIIGAGQRIDRCRAASSCLPCACAPSCRVKPRRSRARFRPRPAGR